MQWHRALPRRTGPQPHDGEHQHDPGILEWDGQRGAQCDCEQEDGLQQYDIQAHNGDHQLDCDSGIQE